MSTILLIVLILLLIGALPTWPYSAGSGLLSDRRPWPAGSDRADSRLVQTHLVCIAPITLETEVDIDEGDGGLFYIGGGQTGGSVVPHPKKVWAGTFLSTDCLRANKAEKKF